MGRFATTVPLYEKLRRRRHPPLKAKGLSSSQVVAINIVDGILTLFAKTA
jgi:hypothetical protein